MGKLHRRLRDELSLYVRQLAWLNTAPKPEKQAVSKGEPIARIKQMEAEGIEPALPEVSFPWMISLLFKVGPVTQTGMGGVPLDWREIAAWSDLTGVELPPWQVQLLRRLSSDYLASARDAEKPDCPAPWQSEADIETNRDTVSRKLGNALRALVMAQQRKRK